MRRPKDLFSRERIPFDEVKDGFLYWITAQNFVLGVFSKEKKCYFGIREKFGMNRLEEEDDWDTGPPFGTAQAVQEICKCPVSLDDGEGLFKWLMRILETGEVNENNQSF